MQHRCMDRSLARGYANRFLDQLTPHGSVLAWHDSPRNARALEKFTESSMSKKPGRVLERLHPLLFPTYGTLQVAAWNRKADIIVTAQAVSSARESAVLHSDDQGQTLFDERAAFFNNLIFRAKGDRAQVFGATSASIGGHAIARLLERGLATPETMQDAVFTLLRRANILQIGIFRAGLNHNRTWELLFPVPGGAAFAVTQRVRPWPGMSAEEFDMVASVRTVLRDDMLTLDQRNRMEGFEEICDSGHRDPEAFSAWLRRNARPWAQTPPEAAVAPH